VDTWENYCAATPPIPYRPRPSIVTSRSHTAIDLFEIVYRAARAARLSNIDRHAEKAGKYSASDEPQIIKIVERWKDREAARCR
jgi:hypothetical protein